MEIKRITGELVSVVVPILNTKIDELKNCLSNIKDQTYENIEVLCIDGGSDTEVINTIRQYLVDPRFKLFSCLPGVSNQRNVGLKYSTGGYILFVDSDDFFDKNFILNLINSIHETKSDIAIPHIHRCEFMNGTMLKEIPYQVSQIEEIVNEQNYFKYSRTGELVNPIKLYKASLIKGNSFLTCSSYGEDLLFNYELSKKEYKTIFVPDAIYNYRVDITHNSTSRRLNKKGLYIVYALANIIKSKKIKEKDAIVGLYNEFDYVFKEFLYSLAKHKKILLLIWMMQFKSIYLKRHHSIHDCLFLFFPIIIVGRRDKKNKNE